MSIEKKIRRITDLSAAWGYSYIRLYAKESCALAVIYDHERVRQSISGTPAWAMERIGYNKNISPVNFLREVGRRWRKTGLIPHEIGLVLGYPCKDVLGYMGLIPLKCSGCCGWKIHGNPGPSLKKSRMYKKAREDAQLFLGKEAV